MDPLSEYKQGARLTWATGDYDQMARTEGLYVTGERLVPGRRGEQRRRGARRRLRHRQHNTPSRHETGAQVTGLDLAPEMLAAAAKRAADAGCDVDWREGDAEAIPFDDNRFDVVLSSFGAMFAPRHEVAADELARVLRAGGRLAMSNWAPDGAIAEFFATVNEPRPTHARVRRPAAAVG